MFDKSAFVQGYAMVTHRSWEDESYFNRLLKEPGSVLKEAGIETRPDAKVNVITLEISGQGKIDDQLALWQKGEETGTYQLLVPLKPENYNPDDFPLSDEMLQSVAGGAMKKGGGNCCCCCPCCSCT